MRARKEVTSPAELVRSTGLDGQGPSLKLTSVITHLQKASISQPYGALAVSQDEALKVAAAVVAAVVVVVVAAVVVVAMVVAVLVHSCSNHLSVKRFRSMLPLSAIPI